MTFQASQPCTWPADRTAILDAYDRDGVVVIHQALNTEQMAAVHGHLQRYIDEVVPQVPPMDVFYEDKSACREIRMLPRMDHHDGVFRTMLTEPPLREIAESLCGHEVTPRDAAFFNKPARVGQATPPHQDGYYFHLEPCQALTLWLALDEVDEQNGCVRYVVGSHRQGMRPHGRTHVLGFSQGISDYGHEQDVKSERAVCVSPGDLIIHDALTIHRADPNPSARSRRALGFVYFSARSHIDAAARDAYQQQLANELQAEGKI